MYWKNRHALAAVGVWLGCLAVGTQLWLHMFVTYLLGQVFAVYVPLHQVLVTLGAGVSAALLAPRVPRLDILGRQSLGWRSGSLAAIFVVAWALVPVVPAVLARLAPGLLSNGTWVDWSDSIETPVELLSGERVVMFTTSAVLFAAVALLATWVGGPVWGPGITLGAWLGLLVAQSTSWGPNLPFGGVGVMTASGISDEPFVMQPVGIAIAASTALLAVWVWYRSRGGWLARELA